jgi:F-type H+-transporting ATPase subunit b
VIRRLTIAAVLMLLATYAFAQSNEPNAVAHGAEKAAHEVAHPNEDHGEHGEAPKTYFGIPGWILKLLNMIVFLAVLGYFLRGPVTTALAQRHEQIQRDAAEARERRIKADQMAADIQARLTQIEQEVRSIRERAEADGQRQRQELMAAAEAEAAKILQSARNEVDNRLKTARHELTEYAGQLASERAEAILKEKITEADQKKLFDESLREVGEVKA